LQTSQFFNALRWRKQYKKPILFDEVRYEGDVDSNWGNMSAEEMTSYFWMAGLSGGYGTHGDTFDNRAGGEETRWWGKGGTLVGKTICLDLPAGAVYKVELIDTWSMTIDQLPDSKPGKFAFKTPIAHCALRVISAR